LTLDACFQLIGNGDEVVPDLEGGGNLVWEDVSIDSMINGTVTISNVGDSGSMVEWEVQSVPEDWGVNWSIRWFINGIKADFEGGFVGSTESEVLFVEVQAPSKKNQEFSGEIVIANVDNPNDIVTINVACNTPRSKVFQTPLFDIIEKFPPIYSIISQLLKL
jgi:hypothetical protein